MFPSRFERQLVSIRGERIRIPDPDALVHLQFRRFAGCPVCNLHLRSFIARQDEITRAGVREVIVFHSTVEDLRKYQAELPFAVIADPGRRLYAEFGVGSAPRALLDPRAWLAILTGILRSTVAVLRGREPLPPIRPEGGSLGLPGDFLIDRDGRVVSHKYGAHADDQWSVDEMFAHAKSATARDASREVA